MSQTPALQWRAAFAIGIRSIDQQHAEMFSRVNDLIGLHQAGQSTLARDELLPSKSNQVVCRESIKHVLA